MGLRRCSKSYSLAQEHVLTWQKLINAIQHEKREKEERVGCTTDNMKKRESNY